MRNFWFFNLFLSTALRRRRDKEPTETFWHEEKGASTRILKRTVARARLQSQPTSSFHRSLTHDFPFLSLNLRLFPLTFVRLVKAVAHFNDSEQILRVLVSLGCFFYPPIYHVMLKNTFLSCANTRVRARSHMRYIPVYVLLKKNTHAQVLARAHTLAPTEQSLKMKPQALYK